MLDFSYLWKRNREIKNVDGLGTSFCRAMHKEGIPSILLLDPVNGVVQRWLNNNNNNLQLNQKLVEWLICLV